MAVLHERPGRLALLGAGVILAAVVTGIVGEQAPRR
jgi:hypothetical protein